MRPVEVSYAVKNCRYKTQLLVWKVVVSGTTYFYEAQPISWDNIARVKDLFQPFVDAAAVINSIMVQCAT